MSFSRLDLVRAVDGGADVRRRLPARSRRVVAGDGVGEALRLVLVRQGEHRAAEPATDHPGCDRPVVVGQVDEQVELRDGDLEVVAEALVALAEEPAERSEVRLRPAARARPRPARTRSFSVTT